jgi:PAS domain S-box-containing protein
VRAKKTIPNSHPLLCWDIYLEGLYRRTKCSNDLDTLEMLMRKNDWHPPIFSLDNALVWENKVIVLTDSKLNIIHATENIFVMNGYQPDEVIGKHPKMFQGPATSLTERAIIKAAVVNEQRFDTIITNYKKDGSIYKCHIEGYPIFNTKGTLVNFIALENAA